jgi:cob(I)alamin adenosyltransferase
MLQIYCGDGKGKTTAAMGLAARMLGRGGKVHIVQYLKGTPSGEIEFFKNIENVTISRCDKNYGFYNTMSELDKKEITACHNKNTEEAYSMLKELDMLILDEVFAAMELGLVDVDSIKRIAGNCGDTELIMTGRNPQKYFTDKADYISEIKKIKHPFDKGTDARRGIEY